MSQPRSHHHLQVDIGYSSLTGPRPRNEDFCGSVTPEGHELENKGIVVAVADGVGGHGNGREASEYTVRGLLADYYATPDTWAVPLALDKVIQALNRWVMTHAARSAASVGMATTLSALVLRGTRYYLAHVGDCRVYRLRGGRLEQLTCDHVWEHPELRSVLSRAIGLQSQLAVDYADGDLQRDDVLVLVSDGVWSALEKPQPPTAHPDPSLAHAPLRDLLLHHPDAQEAATALTDSALLQGSHDNCTAMVVRIIDLPPQRLRQALEAVRQLPLPGLLKPGMIIDGLQVEEVLHASLVTLLYRVRALDSGTPLVLKTLRPEACDDGNTAALVHEEWLTRRVTDGHFPQVFTHAERSALYYLMSWHAGTTLAQRLEQGHRFSSAETVELGLALLRGLAALHRLAIVHRDIKPANLHVDEHGKLRILDLGVAASDAHDQDEVFSEINNPGTPSYMAPELHGLQPASADVLTDLYAVGVTLYELLTRKYPYGEIEPFQKPRFATAVPPTRYRPDIPGWLEAVLLKAVSVDRRQRFETCEEFILALERGAHRPLALPRPRPLWERDPQLGLKLLAAISLVLNVLLAYVLVVR